MAAAGAQAEAQDAGIGLHLTRSTRRTESTTDTVAPSPNTTAAVSATAAPHCHVPAVPLPWTESPANTSTALVLPPTTYPAPAVGPAPATPAKPRNTTVTIAADHATDTGGDCCHRKTNELMSYITCIRILLHVYLVAHNHAYSLAGTSNCRYLRVQVTVELGECFHWTNVSDCNNF